jgi:hypothetical protein
MTESTLPQPPQALILSSPIKRVVRFALTKDELEQQQCCPILMQRQRRQRMLARRRFKKMQNEKLGITKYEYWFSSTELKALQHQCARDVQAMERPTPSSSHHPGMVGAVDNYDYQNEDDDKDVLSLSRFLSCRREKKSLVQRQLLDTISAIQEYHETAVATTEPKRDDFCSNLMASECAKYTKSMAELAHVEGLYWHLHVALQQQKGDL